MTRNKLRRVEAAQSRQTLSDGLTPEQRLAKLDSKFGKGLGAQKERAKLLAKIEKRDAPKVEVKPEEPTVVTDSNDPVVEKPKKKAKERRAQDKNLRHKNKE